MRRMPGVSFQGPLPSATEALYGLEGELRAHVMRLADEIGERHVYRYPSLLLAADYIRSTWGSMGYGVGSQCYEVAGKRCENLEVEVPGTGRSKEIILVGAHYDSVQGSPGANDNGTGVAAILALAKRFADRPTSRTIRFVAFVNEEPPFFQTKEMGSWVYAQRCRHREENLVLMLSLETIGYYSHESHSQHYPPPLSLIYPSTGNFIGFVSKAEYGAWVREVIGVFRQHAAFPSEGASLWGSLPGVGWSDHWAFWQEGYPAVMVTDTALFRDPHYHSPGDTSEHIHFEYLARVVSGLDETLQELGNRRENP